MPGSELMEEYIAVVNGFLRGVMVFLLFVALVAALWTTALVRISDRPAAIPILTAIGTLVLTRDGLGVDQPQYQKMETQAKASPGAQISVPGLKSTVRGSEILGLSYDEVVGKICGKFADAYYVGGARAAFDLSTLPAGITNVFTGNGSLTDYAKSLKLPSWTFGPLGVVDYIGISPNSLTVSGHNTATRSMAIWWLISLLLALGIILVSRQWKRASGVAWPVFFAALPGAILLGIGRSVAAAHIGQQLGTVDSLVTIIANAAIPVYWGAAATGFLALVLTGVLSALTRKRRAGRPAHVSADPAWAQSLVPVEAWGDGVDESYHPTSNEDMAAVPTSNEDMAAVPTSKDSRPGTQDAESGNLPN